MQKYLLRGDFEGFINMWAVPDFSLEEIKSFQTSNATVKVLQNTITTSLEQAWSLMDPPPVGILDQLNHPNEPIVKLLLLLRVFICHNKVGWYLAGREDGIIVIVPATQTVMLKLLQGKHHQFTDWPPNQILAGHSGRVNCLLYPYLVHTRYDRSHLLSGGVEFAICLWDLYSSTLLHCFRVQICSDGTVYVWQMEMGHLDRVLHGMLAEEVLSACDEHSRESGEVTGLTSDFPIRLFISFVVYVIVTLTL
ncbi:CLUMA_CG006350, isoform A [Clunio marinus]|uniref:CLUMA_CG006350, isoform A n=1 Tax=Clunio marinus TaxID=568069 RepID=A0A1J1HZF8_9DIPT|nr:CLUMA_CG006350, isoform A [Clunio marinus]